MGQLKKLQLIKTATVISNLRRRLHYRVPEHSNLLNLNLDRVAL